MRIAHVVPSLALRTGGTAESVVQAALALEDQGAETTIFATDGAGPANAPYRPVDPSELPRGSDRLDIRLFPVRPPSRFAFAPGLYRALGQDLLSFDVVHVHSLFLFPQLAAYLQAHRQGRPYVVAPCGALDPYLRARGHLRKAFVDAVWQRRMLQGAAALHFKTEEEARLVSDLALRPPAIVAPNGIRWSDFQTLPPPDAFRSRLGAGSAPIVLAYGRISHKKGLDRLIDAFALVRQDLKDVRLVIAGPDDEGLVPVLRARAQDANVEADVFFPGMLEGRERLEALAAADVYALASRTENFGLAVVEALAAGVAGVISPAVNLAAEIESAGAAIVCPPEPVRLADALRELLTEPERRAGLGRRAREFTRRYDWAVAIPHWLTMYERAVDAGVRA